MTSPAVQTFPVNDDGLTLRWRRAFTLIPIAYAIGVIVQRRDEPNLPRTILLVLLGTLPVVLDDRCRARYPSVRRVPELVFAIPSFVAVAALLMHPVDVDLAPFLLFLVTIQATVTGTLLDGLAVAVISSAVMVTADVSGHYNGSFIWVLGMALAWTGGFAVRSLLSILTELKAAQSTLAEQAAVDERRRIAREIHDVIAHSLSVASLHITGARMAVERGRGDALEALEEAETLTRQSLNQVRSVVGMLEPVADGTAPALPTATDIDALVAQFEHAGVHVDYEVDGDLSEVSPTAGLTLYRVTQESLSNVVRHAAGMPVSIRIRARDGEVRLLVTNPLTEGSAASNGTGRGLHGMRERAGTHGGSLEAGASGGKWRVELAIPA